MEVDAEGAGGILIGVIGWKIELRAATFDSNASL